VAESYFAVLSDILPDTFRQTVGFLDSASSHQSIFATQFSLDICSSPGAEGGPVCLLYLVGLCQVPSSNHTRTKNGCSPGLGELPKILGFPFNISSTAEASDFKFGT